MDQPEEPIPTPPAYLAPYLQAARTCGGGFGTLLWASPATQAVRFEAIRRIYDPAGRSVLDVGCGRADYLGFLLDRGIRPADYIGIEAVGPLADAADERAEQARRAGVAVRILRADFVREPVRIFVGADVVMFSGSLNTAGDDVFYPTLRRAYEAAAEAMVFNFLDSTMLAGRDYLVWRRPADVLRFAGSLSADVRVRDEYLPGDCTVAVVKRGEE